MGKRVVRSKEGVSEIDQEGVFDRSSWRGCVGGRLEGVFASSSLEGVLAVDVRVCLMYLTWILPRLSQG